MTILKLFLVLWLYSVKTQLSAQNGFLCPWENLLDSQQVTLPSLELLSQELFLTSQSQSSGELKTILLSDAKDVFIIPSLFWCHNTKKEVCYSLSVVSSDDGLIGRFAFIKKTFDPKLLVSKIKTSFETKDDSSLQIQWTSVPKNLSFDHHIRSLLQGLGFEVKAQLAQEYQSFIKKRFHLSTPAKNRPTRIFSFFSHGSSFHISVASGISAQKSATSIEGFWQEPLPKNLLTMLEKEKKDLSHQGPIKVLKQKGAWVYVDKGRSWGLDIEDRLQTDSGQKAHVIGFFGHEEGLDVSEGAILFVTKGQKNIKKNDIFVYDQTVYPTPWPP